jgi:hypothetical protein
MTESTHRDSARRSRLLEAAQKELARFEQIETDFRKRIWPSAPLSFAFHTINVH